MTTIDPNRICYEDDRLLVYNKPAGVHSVANTQNPGTSLAEALIEYDARYAQASPEARDAGLIQRLDYWTSGCLLIAKDKACWGKLINARKQLSIKKLYRALVEGHMQDATLSSYLGSPYRRAKKVKVYLQEPRDHSRVQEATSTYKLFTYCPELQCSVVQIQADEGRRHQIRAHAAFLGHPLVGDELYGSKTQLTRISALGQRDFFLHAESLSFKHPFTNLSIFTTASLELDLLSDCF